MQSVSRGCWPSPHRTSWVARDNRPSVNRSSHDTVCTNDRSFSNRHARPNESTGSDPGICSDFNRRSHQLEIVPQVMRGGTETRILADYRLATDTNGSDVVDFAIPTDGRPILDLKIPRCPYAHRRIDDRTGTNFGAAKSQDLPPPAMEWSRCQSKNRKMADAPN